MAAADGRYRHPEAACCLRKAVRLDDLCEDHQRIEIDRRFPKIGKFIPSFAV
jgi:hypothetical protein